MRFYCFVCCDLFPLLYIHAVEHPNLRCRCFNDTEGSFEVLQRAAPILNVLELILFSVGFRTAFLAFVFIYNSISNDMWMYFTPARSFWEDSSFINKQNACVLNRKGCLCNSHCKSHLAILNTGLQVRFGKAAHVNQNSECLKGTQKCVCLCVVRLDYFCLSGTVF